ncbi:MAG: transposase [Elusimicrobiota bacterium]
MPRKPRIEYSGAFYHVISRGNNRKVIFHKRDDYKEFLKCLEITRQRYPYILYAYKLMPNHFHLLIETKGDKLSVIMQSMLTRYARYFNIKYKKVGHLFQGRYKAILCQKENYLLELIRYIHLNCIRAGLVKSPSQWLWSSHRVYLGLERNPIVDDRKVLEFFDRDINNARKKYAEFIREGITLKSRKELYPPERFPVLGNEKFLEKIGKEEKELRRRFDVTFRVGLENLIKVVANVTGIHKDKISGSQQTRECSFARDIFSYIARNYCKQKVSKIACFLHRSISTITMSLRRTESRLNANSRYKSVIKEVTKRIKK